MSKADKKQAKRDRMHARQQGGTVEALLRHREDKENDRLAKELAAALEDERFEIERQRRNALPLGHPDNREKIDITFGPLDRWLDELEETGDIDVINGGLAVFKPGNMGGANEDDEYVPLAEAFHAVCDTFELIATDLAIPYRADGLRRLANKIHYGVPQFQSDVDEARAAIAWLRTTSALLTPNEFSQFSVAIQVRAELAQREKERKRAA